MVPRRILEELEFRPPATADVLRHMDALSAARDGWINLLPGVPGEAAELPPRGIFSGLFGSPELPVSMCTWMPRGARGSPASQTVGILHPRGRGAAAQLSELGVPVPAGWLVRQDHGKRGLIVHPAQDASCADVLHWTLRAGEVLALMPLTGAWQARVYLPRWRASPS